MGILLQSRPRLKNNERYCWIFLGRDSLGSCANRSKVRKI